MADHRLFVFFVLSLSLDYCVQLSVYGFWLFQHIPGLVLGSGMGFSGGFLPFIFRISSSSDEVGRWVPWVRFWAANFVLFINL